jgi:hypothetical protein
MRRPLNWVVVCVSLLVLVANLQLPDRNSRLPDRRVVAPAFAETLLPVSLSAPDSTPEFGYVRADGSFVPLAQQSGPKRSAAELASVEPVISISPSWQ